MNLERKKIFFKILMFLTAFLFGLSLINIEFNITRICISLSFLLTSLGSYYEWYSISKKLKNF